MYRPKECGTEKIQCYLSAINYFVPSPFDKLAPVRNTMSQPPCHNRDRLAQDAGQKDSEQGARAVATPCRQLMELGEGIGVESIPDINDTTAERPKAGVLRISQDAIDARLRRVFTPNVRGEYKLSAEIVAQWKS